MWVAVNHLQDGRTKTGLMRSRAAATIVAILWFSADARRAMRPRTVVGRVDEPRDGASAVGCRALQQIADNRN